MGTAYRALSNIDHGGEADPETGAVIPGTAKYFKFGEVVTGLPKEVMKNLWDAGVLERVDTPNEPVRSEEQTAPDASSSGGTSPAPAD